MDRLTALRVFRAIVREGSFAAAARRLRLSPAAVSKNLAELEAQLGLRLLNRTTRRLSLTGAGEIYSRRIARVLDDLEEADRSVAELSEEVSGRLRVSAPLTLGLIVLSPVVPMFLQKYPRVSLDLDLNDRRVDIVKEGFDLVIRGGESLEDSGLLARKIATLTYGICGSPDYLRRHGAPDRPEALAAHNFVQFSLPEQPRFCTFQRGSEKVEVPLASRYAVTSSLAVRDVLRVGFGIGRIPEIYVEDDLSTGRLVKVLSEWSTGLLNIFAVYPSRRYAPAATTAFLEFLTETFRQA